ncbi:signal peptidase I [Amnibacterium setariae]|uniref:Signal peptidase I n=1 Tax=Amnibacterium setariae TaxID=2306585 RepID=A0A3A1TZK3_9MICO|nr:signal peptidase I [Amnibacterium setariae]RIX30074.1 signal peptidase I [Amnibacterium setariae]
MGSAEQLVRGRRPSAGRPAPAPSAAGWVLVVIAGLCRSLLLTGVALASWTVVPGLVGLHATTVMSGSMEPRFQVGDAVVAKPVQRADLAIGQVLLFDDPDERGALRMHRLVAARGQVLTTKGDANDVRDSSTVPFSAVQGVGFLRVPYAGLPAYWIRTGQLQPLLLTGTAAVLLAVGTLLDRRFLTGRHVAPDSEARRRRQARHRLAASSTLVLVLLATAGRAVAPAQASFANATSNGPSVVTGCWDWPLRGTLPSSALAYFNFMESSGSTTVNRVGGTSVSTYGTVVRGAGTCTTDASPFLTLGTAGASGLVSPTSSTMPSGGVTIASWFRTSTASGVIADLGNSGQGSTGSSLSSVVVYLDSNGSVVIGVPTAVVAGGVVTVMTCRSPSGYANGTWHLLIATFSASTGCTVAVDGTTPVGSAATNSSLVNLSLLSGTTTWWRLGYDTIASAYPNRGSRAWFTGDLDETQVYSAVLTTTEQQAIVDRRH